MSDPRDQAFEAYEEFAGICEELDDESPALRLRKEADAFEAFSERVAECYANGLTSVTAGQFASMVADVSGSLNKTEAKQHIVSKTQTRKNDAADRPALNGWLTESLQEVRVVRTTDHVDRTRYVWDFGTTTLETESGDEGRAHYHWKNFRDSIYDAGGPYCAPPDENLRAMEEWRDWIVTQLERHKTEKTTLGPRSRAVDTLQNRVRRAEAYGELSMALDYQGIYLEFAGEQPTETVTEFGEHTIQTLYIPNEWPTEVVEDHGISVQALQNEIDARGFMLEGHSKIATQEYVDGQYATFWVVTGDFATPAIYSTDGRDRTGGREFESDGTVSEPDFEGGSIGGDSNE